MQRAYSIFAVLCGLSCLFCFICSISIVSQATVCEILFSSFDFSYHFATCCGKLAAQTALHVLRPDFAWLWLRLAGSVLCDFVLGRVVRIFEKWSATARCIFPARKIGHQRFCSPRGKRFDLRRARFCNDPCVVVCPTTDIAQLHAKTDRDKCCAMPFFNQIKSAELRGGAGGGGAAATRRQRDERDLLKGLKELLESFAQP